MLNVIKLTWCTHFGGNQGRTPSSESIRKEQGQAEDKIEKLRQEKLFLTQEKAETQNQSSCCEIRGHPSVCIT